MAFLYENRPSNGREWETPCIECNKDLPFFCYSWCCPCCAFGDLQEARNQGPFVQNCAACAGLGMLGCYALLPRHGRTQYRQKEGINGSILEDCALECLCLPCALTQERIDWERTEKARNEKEKELQQQAIPAAQPDYLESA